MLRVSGISENGQTKYTPNNIMMKRTRTSSSQKPKDEGARQPGRKLPLYGGTIYYNPTFTDQEGWEMVEFDTVLLSIMRTKTPEEQIASVRKLTQANK